MTRRARIVVLAAGLSLVASVLFGASPVSADAAGPTDYRSEISGVEPATDAISVTIEGGDAFVRIAAVAGSEVLVFGYEGEPYLRIDADGTVMENRRSPATYLNRDRYGSDVPESASADAEPEWVVVARNGAYAWHDHRAHRMEPFAPVDASRGDTVLEGVIPIDVDGRAVSILVTTRWMPAPSAWPAVLGAIIGTAATVLAAMAGRVAPVVAVTAAAATVVGWLQYRSLPGETEPVAAWWLLPLVALGFAVVGMLLGRSPTAHAATAIAAVQIALWGYTRRDGLRRAILPTDAPFWLDRFVGAAAVTVGLVGAAVALVALVKPPELQTPAGSPA
jgi:hypothetical protein